MVLNEVSCNYEYVNKNDVQKKEKEDNIGHACRL